MGELTMDLSKKEWAEVTTELGPYSRAGVNNLRNNLKLASGDVFEFKIVWIPRTDGTKRGTIWRRCK